MLPLNVMPACDPFQTIYTTVRCLCHRTIWLESPLIADVVQVTNDILARFGLTMSMEVKAGLMGMPAKQSAEHLFASFGPGAIPADYTCVRADASSLAEPER